MTTTPLVPLALFGFLPIALLAFWLLPRRVALLAVTIAGVLFLPMSAYKVKGIPELSKASVVSYALVLGMLLFDLGRVISFRPRWVDLPMLAWCVVPFASSISNGLGVYDGLSAFFYTTLLYGVPYFAGRLYFTNLHSLR